MKQVPFLDPLDTFAPRHIGPRGDDVDAMLKAVGAPSLDDLIDEAIPGSIRIGSMTFVARPRSPGQVDCGILARWRGVDEGAGLFDRSHRGGQDTVAMPEQ